MNFYKKTSLYPSKNYYPKDVAIPPNTNVWSLLIIGVGLIMQNNEVKTNINLIYLKL